MTLARTERDGLELLLLYLGPSCQSLSRVNYRVRSHSIGLQHPCASLISFSALWNSLAIHKLQTVPHSPFSVTLSPQYISTLPSILTLVKTLWHVSCSSNMGRTVGRFQYTHCSAWRVPCSLWSVVLSLPEWVYIVPFLTFYHSVTLTDKNIHMETALYGPPHLGVSVSLLELQSNARIMGGLSGTRDESKLLVLEKEDPSSHPKIHYMYSLSATQAHI